MKNIILFLIAGLLGRSLAVLNNAQKDSVAATKPQSLDNANNDLTSAAYFHDPAYQYLPSLTNKQATNQWQPILNTENAANGQTQQSASADHLDSIAQSSAYLQNHDQIHAQYNVQHNQRLPMTLYQSKQQLATGTPTPKGDLPNQSLNQIAYQKQHYTNKNPEYLSLTKTTLAPITTTTLYYGPDHQYLPATARPIATTALPNIQKHTLSEQHQQKAQEYQQHFNQQQYEQLLHNEKQAAQEQNEKLYGNLQHNEQQQQGYKQHLNHQHYEHQQQKQQLANKLNENKHAQGSQDYQQQQQNQPEQGYKQHYEQQHKYKQQLLYQEQQQLLNQEHEKQYAQSLKDHKQQQKQQEPGHEQYFNEQHYQKQQQYKEQQQQHQLLSQQHKKQHAQGPRDQFYGNLQKEQGYKQHSNQQQYEQHQQHEKQLTQQQEYYVKQQQEQQQQQEKQQQQQNQQQQKQQQQPQHQNQQQQLQSQQQPHQNQQQPQQKQQSTQNMQGLQQQHQQLFNQQHEQGQNEQLYGTLHYNEQQHNAQQKQQEILEQHQLKRDYEKQRLEQQQREQLLQQQYNDKQQQQQQQQQHAQEQQHQQQLEIPLLAENSNKNSANNNHNHRYSLQTTSTTSNSLLPPNSVQPPKVLHEGYRYNTPALAMTGNLKMPYNELGISDDKAVTTHTEQHKSRTEMQTHKGYVYGRPQAEIAENNTTHLYPSEMSPTYIERLKNKNRLKISNKQTELESKTITSRPQVLDTQSLNRFSASTTTQRPAQVQNQYATSGVNEYFNREPFEQRPKHDVANSRPSSGVLVSDLNVYGTQASIPAAIAQTQQQQLSQQQLLQQKLSQQQLSQQQLSPQQLSQQTLSQQQLSQQQHSQQQLSQQQLSQQQLSQQQLSQQQLSQQQHSQQKLSPQQLLQQQHSQQQLSQQQLSSQQLSQQQLSQQQLSQQQLSQQQLSQQQLLQQQLSQQQLSQQQYSQQQLPQQQLSQQQLSPQQLSQQQLSQPHQQFSNDLATITKNQAAQQTRPNNTPATLDVPNPIKSSHTESSVQQHPIVVEINQSTGEKFYKMPVPAHLNVHETKEHWQIQQPNIAANPFVQFNYPTQAAALNSNRFENLNNGQQYPVSQFNNSYGTNLLPGPYQNLPLPRPLNPSAIRINQPLSLNPNANPTTSSMENSRPLPRPLNPSAIPINQPLSLNSNAYPTTSSMANSRPLLNQNGIQKSAPLLPLQSTQGLNLQPSIQNTLNAKPFIAQNFNYHPNVEISKMPFHNQQSFRPMITANHENTIRGQSPLSIPNIQKSPETLELESQKYFPLNQNPASVYPQQTEQQRQLFPNKSTQTHKIPGTNTIGNIFAETGIVSTTTSVPTTFNSNGLSSNPLRPIFSIPNTIISPYVNVMTQPDFLQVPSQELPYIYKTSKLINNKPLAVQQQQQQPIVPTDAVLQSQQSQVVRQPHLTYGPALQADSTPMSNSAAYSNMIEPRLYTG